MALMRSQPDKEPEMAGDSYTTKERLYLTAAGEVVTEGDPQAAELYATPGQAISRAEAERLGLVKAEAKAAAKPADKSRKAAEDKGA